MVVTGITWLLILLSVNMMGNKLKLSGWAYARVMVPVFDCRLYLVLIGMESKLR